MIMENHGGANGTTVEWLLHLRYSLVKMRGRRPHLRSSRHRACLKDRDRSVLLCLAHEGTTPAERETLLLAIHSIDVALIGVYLLAVIAIGLWLGRGQRQMSDYLLGGRDLPWWALLGSIVATETSTATFLSIPGIAFGDGGDLRYLQLPIGYILGRCLIVVLFLPSYFRGRLFTAYEVLDQRFGGAAKQTASVLFLVTRNLGDGLRLFLAAIVLEKMVGLSLPLCILILGLATIVYTVFGGMKSVVWNDCIQFVIYVIGGVLALLVIVHKLPEGWQQVYHFASANGKLRVFDFRWAWQDPFTIYAGILGGMFLTLGTHGTDQMMVQRYLCARSQRDSGKALIASGFVVLGQFALFLFVGVGLACFYDQYPPGRAFERNDEVFAAFIVDHLPPGMVGLTLAAVFAAAMSTLSSSLNSSAAALVNDLYLPRAKRDPSPSRLVAISRGMTVLFGIIQIGVAVAGQYFVTNVVNDVLAIAGFTAGVLLGVFLLGVLTQQVGQRSALAGMVAGLMTVAWTKFCTDLAWTWYSTVGAAATFFGGLAVWWVLSHVVSGRDPS